ncbi:MAG: HAMP domain-containing histidine kinase, partial [Anaerotignum sp.]|nr:HAMP domain-containing histidine kinase [Anaerotignum sp.]
EAFFKDVYAEVRESLIDSPQVQEIVEEIADEISSETILPAPEEGTVAATVIPNALHTFLARPKDVVEMDLIAAAKDAMASLQAFAEKQNIKLHLSTTCETLMMKADPDSIRILFRNIIDNSIKYMGRPGHMIITISLLGDDIFLILKDTGNGLSEEETTHVFELNFQGSNRVSGNGLGLTQTKMIVEAFGGTIYAKSSPGNGMAIYIQLPVSGSTLQ